MVIAAVEGKEILIGQLRDCLRIAAGAHAVSIIRVKRIHNQSPEHLLRGGEHSLHLIVYDAVYTEISVLIDLIMPALLPKDLLPAINVRMEYRIHIDVHQIFKILVVAAGRRIHRVIREGHRVEKGIERALHQLDKRIFERKFFRTAEHGMLQYMRYAGAVLRRRAEAHTEYLVVVLIGEHTYTRAGFYMPEHGSHALAVLQFFLIHQLVGRCQHFLPSFHSFLAFRRLNGIFILFTHFQFSMLLLFY